MSARVLYFSKTSGMYWKPWAPRTHEKWWFWPPKNWVTIKIYKNPSKKLGFAGRWDPWYLYSAQLCKTGTRGAKIRSGSSLCCRIHALGREVADGSGLVYCNKNWRKPYLSGFWIEVPEVEKGWSLSMLMKKSSTSELIDLLKIFWKLKHIIIIMIYNMFLGSFSLASGAGAIYRWSRSSSSFWGDASYRTDAAQGGSDWGLVEMAVVGFYDKIS